MADRDLLVRIIGDDRDLQRALANTDRKLDNIDRRTASFGRNVGRAFAAVGVTLGTAEILRFASDAVDSAADLNKQISRTEAILGDSADATIAWSRTTAQSMGISQRAALGASATYASLFQTFDVGQDKAAEFSQVLVGLAADLASFSGTSPEQALRALRSGVAGSIRALRPYNIFLTAARVEQEALAESGKHSAKALTDQERVLARYNLILRDAGPAIGNFKDTSDELTNQQRILRASFDDLSTNMGEILIPVLTDATDAANLLFLALDQMRGVDFSPGFDFPDIPDFLRPAAIAPISPAGAVALGVKRFLERDDAGLNDVAEQITGSVNTTIAELQEALAKRSDAIEKIQDRDLQRSRDKFSALTKGLGLKLDKAGLTATLSDDIAALRELERAILRQIEVEGKTFKLVEQLTKTRLAISSLVQTQADDAQQAGEDAFRAVIDALELDLERAQATAGLGDDQAALRALEKRILARIAAEGETTGLLRELFQVRQQQADVARQLTEQRREQRERQQFLDLGLTAEGEERTPGGGALRRRAASLEERIKGTALDTKKNRQTLDRIQQVLAGDFRKVGKNVREAILQMLNDITSALEGEGSKKGPLTKTSGLNTKKLLAGLGLSEEEIQALRSRLSGFNTAGLQIASGQATSASGARVGERGFGNIPIFVESTTTINLDGQQVAKVVTKQQQKSRRRNPQQKRGPNRR